MNRAAELSPEALAGRLAEIANDKKASDLVALDVRGLVGYTDFLVICTARNERQAKAIHDEVYHQIKRGGRLPACHSPPINCRPCQTVSSSDMSHLL